NDVFSPLERADEPNGPFEIRCGYVVAQPMRVPQHVGVKSEHSHVVNELSGALTLLRQLTQNLDDQLQVGTKNIALEPKSTDRFHLYALDIDLDQPRASTLVHGEHARQWASNHLGRARLGRIPSWRHARSADVVVRRQI